MKCKMKNKIYFKKLIKYLFNKVFNQNIELMGKMHLKTVTEITVK